MKNFYLVKLFKNNSKQNEQTEDRELQIVLKNNTYFNLQNQQNCNIGEKTIPRRRKPTPTKVIKKLEWKIEFLCKKKFEARKAKIRSSKKTEEESMKKEGRRKVDLFWTKSWHRFLRERERGSISRMGIRECVKILKWERGTTCFGVQREIVCMVLVRVMAAVWLDGWMKSSPIFNIKNRPKSSLNSIC